MNATADAITAPTPVELGSNQPADRFYRGGPRIATFRGEASRVGPTDGALSAATLNRAPSGEGLMDGDVLAAGAAEYFRLERVTVSGEAYLDRGFAVPIATAGSLTVTARDGTTLDPPRGTTSLVPFAAGDLSVCGHGQVLVAHPPRTEPAA